MSPTLAQLNSGVEAPESYCEKGYHPVKINDTFNHGRYRILHKLGHGAISTVWLALNQHQGRKNAPKARYVAVKILMAEISTTENKTTESDILRQLEHKNSWLHCLSSLFRRIWGFMTAWTPRVLSFRYPVQPRARPFERLGALQHSGQEFVVSLLDEFICDGPNGRHNCIVMNLLGPSLLALEGLDMMENGRYLLPIELARQAVYQSAKGLEFLHSRGIVHGDFHKGNIAIVISEEIQSFTVEELYIRLGKPISMPFEEVASPNIDQEPTEATRLMYQEIGVDYPVRRLNPLSRPEYMVSPIKTLTLWELCRVTEFKICIVDFSESWYSPRSWLHRSLLPLPKHQEVPGRTNCISVGADIWAFVCTTYGLFGNIPLFQLGKLFDEDPHYQLANIMVALGGKEKIPKWAWEQWAITYQMERFFSEDEIYNDVVRDTADLVQRAQRAKSDGYEPPVADADTAVLLEILRRACHWEPSDRATAAKLSAIVPEEWGINNTVIP